MRIIFLAGAMLAAAACSQPQQSASTNTSAAQASFATFKSTLDTKEFMGHVIDNAADGIWLHQGWDTGADGEVELFPQDDRGWALTENAAATLAEASNLLLVPERTQDTEDDKDWSKFANQLHDAALKAKDTAEKRDKEAFFQAGGEIYVVCSACHLKYLIGDVPGPVEKLPDLPAEFQKKN